MKRELRTPTHIYIPDTQCRPGTPRDHLTWAGRYIVDEFAGKDKVKIIHAGDHADMHSLSMYDQGKMGMEGRRYREDIEVANQGFLELNAPLIAYNKSRSAKWWPERHLTLGNHEDRINRAVESDAKLEGVISTNDLNYSELGWKVHAFRVPVCIDGVYYAHYFYNPMTGKPLGGMVDTRLKTLGHSFTQGHQQTLSYALRFVAGQSQHGLVAGAFYLHDEDYKGPQGNAHWRGLIVCHQVENGSYDPMFVSMDYLCRRYEGMRLDKFIEKKYPMSKRGW